MKESKVLYDSFNARYLSFEEIANTFIPNGQYDELIKNSHSLLMGPRGSGKTTLLKMLTPACQYYWMKKQSKSINIPFIGVYVPTDIQWKRQIEQFQKEYKNFPVFQDVIPKQIVKNNILISLCKTFLHLLEFYKNGESLDLSKEAAFCTDIINDWSIPKPTSPNIQSIMQGLLNRTREINNLIHECKISRLQDREIIYPKYFSDNYFDLVVLGCFIFKKHFEKDAAFAGFTFRWAFCFDELEIAPKWLQMDLLDKIRSTSEQDIILKLTTSPIISLVDKIKKDFYTVDARQNEDYKIIRTWTYDENEAKKWGVFSNELVTNKLQRQFNKNIDVNALFGIDSIDRNLELTFSDVDFTHKKGELYEKGGVVWYLFKELAIIDRSFREFLTSKGINYLNPVPVFPGQEDQVHRKIKPIATFRYQFINELGKKRSRKNTSLFYGLPFIYQICDGNPRALIGLIDELISLGIKDENGDLKEFYINKQSAIITDISNKYLKLIETHPDSNIFYSGKYVNLGKILKIIGDYFHKKLIIDDFKMDPVGSFTIDDKVNHQVIDLLELAVHLGAIIYLNPTEAITSSGLIGKKFRLTYLLHPIFRLPKREYTSIKLSNILNKTGSNNLNQALLFNED